MTIRLLLLYLCIVIASTSCDLGSKRIIGDFKYWRDGLESTATITYRSQAIIDTTAYVIDYWNDDNYIIAETRFYRKKTTDELGAAYYYIIHLEGYRKEPKQLRSNAVVGPLSSDSLVLYVENNDLAIDPDFSKLLKSE